MNRSVRDVHGGVDGGVVFEPFHELTAVLGQMADGRGNIRIPRM